MATKKKEKKKEITTKLTGPSVLALDLERKKKVCPAIKDGKKLLLFMLSMAH